MVDRGRKRRVHTADTSLERSRRQELARLSGDRERVPVGRGADLGYYTTGRLPTADEQARGEWPGDEDEA